MTWYAVTLSDTISIPLLSAIFTAVGVIGKIMIDTWRGAIRAKADIARVEHVDVPQAQAQSWIELFKIANDTALSLKADVAKLEKRLDDQDEEHRIELADRDKRYNELAELQRETSGSLRRLRSYVVIVTNLLNEHGIAFPPMPDEDTAPERRSPTVSVVADAVIMKADLDPIDKKEMKK